MDTPIVDFVKKYIKSDMARFHMPGHKGHVFFGCEPFDITEVKGRGNGRQGWMTHCMSLALLWGRIHFR